MTDECKVLKDEADKLNCQHDSGSKKSRYNKSKEYKKNSNEKDLNTFYEERFKELEGELKKQQNLAVTFRRSSRLLSKRTTRILTLNPLLVNNRSYDRLMAIII